MSIHLLRCTCTHAFQDNRYGRGIRVHAECKDNKARCSVCSTVRDIPRSKVEQKEAKTK